jgi:Ca2+-binding EF-hand superfamily protein
MQGDNVLQYLDQTELVTYQEMFSLFDKEDTGTMFIEEVPLFIRGLGHCPTEAELKSMMKSLDPNEEGTVSFSAIVSALVKRKK